MTRPSLPPVPKPVQRRYRSSGKCPVLGRALMFGLSPIVALVIGALALLCARFGWHPLLEAAAAYAIQSGGAVLRLVQWPLTAIFLLYTFAYPILIGSLIGWATAKASLRGKCRNGFLVAGSAILSLVSGYLGIVGLDVLGTGGVHGSSYQLTAGPHFLTFVDGLLYSAAGALPVWALTGEPFCESCDAWYGPEITCVPTIPVERASDFLASLTSPGAVRPATGVEGPPVTRFRYLDSYAQKSNRQRRRGLSSERVHARNVIRLTSS